MNDAGRLSIRLLSNQICVRTILLTLGSVAMVYGLGCVRRTMTINTEPAGALVYINDQEVGRSRLQREFLWYGDYDIVIRKEGYKTLKTHWNIDPPWYQVPPLDFFAEVLWPGEIHDQKERTFELVPEDSIDIGKLETRAIEMQRDIQSGAAQSASP